MSVLLKIPIDFNIYLGIVMLSFLSAPQALVLTEGSGGLFDFNATLPIMAIQFILLSIVLTIVFYKPIGKVIDDRNSYVNNNLITASEKLIKADELYKQYNEQLKAARVSAEATIAQSEKEAKDYVASEINETRKDAAKLIEKTNRELEEQKSLILEHIQVRTLIPSYGLNELTQIVKEKLLGKEIVL
jgi:F-type H+-transporting ATPase subunit b